MSHVHISSTQRSTTAPSDDLNSFLWKLAGPFRVQSIELSMCHGFQVAYIQN